MRATETPMEELAMFKFDEELAQDEARKPKVAVEAVSHRPARHRRLPLKRTAKRKTGTRT
jgi:hypothetical protein